MIPYPNIYQLQFPDKYFILSITNSQTISNALDHILELKIVPKKVYYNNWVLKIPLMIIGLSVRLGLRFVAPNIFYGFNMGNIKLNL